MRIQYSVEDLRGFCCLVRTGQFADAANQLCITASALSRRIQNLERAIGGRVFDRTTRKIRLTPLGMALYERVVPLLSDLDAGIVEASRHARGDEGSLVIASVASVAYSSLPRVLAPFQSRYPGVFISVRDGIASSIASLVEERIAEFGIATHMAFGPGLEVRGLGHYHYRLIYASGNPLIGKKRAVTWADLKPLNVVGLNRLSSTRLQIDDELASRNLAVPWCMEVDQLSTLLGLVRDWGFSAVVPSLMNTTTLGLRSMPIGGINIDREFYLVKRPDVTLSPHAAFLAELLEDQLGATHALRHPT